jgi:hypothetical protein
MAARASAFGLQAPADLFVCLAEARSQEPEASGAYAVGSVPAPL